MYKFFWNGPFSNWYLQDFTWNNIKFNCAEQAMMWAKASPEDRIWGIGYAEDVALDNIDDWGMNLLGKCLNAVAAKLWPEEL